MSPEILLRPDGRGRGELIGFMQWLINRDLRSFVGLMARCVPLNVVLVAEEKVFRSTEEVLAELERRGLGSGPKKIFPVPVKAISCSCFLSRFVVGKPWR